MEDTNFHDKIAEICLKYFKTLPKTGKPNQNEWTILSCIVQEVESNLMIVSLGTGSKCIGKSKMSDKGDILNDSHAEIICRKSFLRYIYYQMSLTSSILNFNENSKKFFLKPGVNFHFFTTHVPCGDAAIFLKQNINEFGDVLDVLEAPSSKRIKLDDIFRTGAKCIQHSTEVDPKLPGVEYHVTGVVRTKPGRGDPTLSVSCSDKLAKWCHLGLQGALLSILLEKPIYLSSFTIAGNTPFCQQALERALYNRFGEVPLKNNYKQCKMVIGKSSKKFEFTKEDGKQPCPSSISYSAVNGKSTEIAVDGKRQGVTKKKLNTEAGRLKICKMELFKFFLQLCGEKNIVLNSDSDNETLSYGCAKLLSTDYQESWNVLRQSFKTWTQKDVGLLDFLVK